MYNCTVCITSLPAVACKLQSQFAPVYMPFNIFSEGVCGKIWIFYNSKLVIELLFLSRSTIGFCYSTGKVGKGLYWYLCVVGCAHGPRPYICFKQCWNWWPEWPELLDDRKLRMIYFKGKKQGIKWLKTAENAFVIVAFAADINFVFWIEPIG